MLLFLVLMRKPISNVEPINFETDSKQLLLWAPFLLWTKIT